jgi:hypothetical protein
MKRLVQWLVAKPRLLGWLLGRGRVRVRDNDKLYVRVANRWRLLPIRVKMHQTPEDFGSEPPRRTA